MAEVPPSSGKGAAAPAVPSSRALSVFSDLLFDIKDDIPEGRYLELCNAAQRVHDEKKPTPPQANYPRNEEGEDDSSDEEMNQQPHEGAAAAPMAGLRSNHGQAIAQFATMIETLRTDMRILRSDNEGLETQLDGATVTIDRLRDRREHYQKATSALKSVVIRHKIPDSELLKAYERVGIKDQVLKDRQGRKRAREVDVEDVEEDEFNAAFSD